MLMLVLCIGVFASSAVSASLGMAMNSGSESPENKEEMDIWNDVVFTQENVTNVILALAAFAMMWIWMEVFGKMILLGTGIFLLVDVIVSTIVEIAYLM